MQRNLKSGTNFRPQISIRLNTNFYSLRLAKELVVLLSETAIVTRISTMYQTDRTGNRLKPDKTKIKYGDEISIENKITANYQ